MKIERDSQRSKLYKAEKVLESHSQRVETIPEVTTFLLKVLGKAPIQTRYGPQLRAPIRIRDGRRCRNALGGSDGIQMPRWSRTQYIVLHEAAHTISQRLYGQQVAGHGWQYAAIYLDLVRFGLGAEAHAALKASFKAHKVRFTEKRQRIATPAMLERLAQAREKQRAIRTDGL